MSKATAGLTTGQKIFWGIGVTVVAIVGYKLIFPTKTEEFVIDETTSSADGTPASKAAKKYDACGGCPSGFTCRNGWCIVI